MRHARSIAGYTAVAAAVPYFVLKIIWLSGGTVGMTAGTPLGAEFDALNAFTFLMDAVAIGVALAMTRPWGMRLPAPVVLFPMWVGTGFLATIVVGVPIATAVSAARGDNIFATDGASLVQPWVYEVVYAGFIVQGVSLMTAFFLYSRARWPRLPEGTRSSELGKLQKQLGIGAAGLAALLGVLHLFWALGGTAGLPAQYIATSAFTGRFMDFVFGGLSILGAVGMFRLVRRRGSRWTAVLLVWVGAATNFSWGFWVTLNMLTDSPLTAGTREMGLLGLVNLARLLAGMLMGVVAAVDLAAARDTELQQATAEKQAPAGQQASADQRDERLAV